MCQFGKGSVAKRQSARTYSDDHMNWTQTYEDRDQ